MSKRLFRALEIVSEPKRCQACDGAIAMVRRARLSWRCDVCGVLHEPPINDNSGEFSSEPASDLDNLCRWIALIEGKSPLIDSIYIGPDVDTDKAAIHKRRKRPVTFDESVYEQLMSVSGFRVGLTEKQIETFFELVSWAIQTVRRLETLWQTQDGRKHAMVLIATYMMSGQECRDYWRKRASLETWVGLLCAPAEMRCRWFGWQDNQGRFRTDVGMRLAHAYGKQLLDDARAAYQRLPKAASRAVLDRPRLRTEFLYDAVATCMREAWQYIRAMDELSESTKAQEAALLAA